MDNITIGQISALVLGLSAFIGGITSLKRFASKLVDDVIEKSIKPLDEKIENLTRQLNDVDVENCKNYLVQFLADVERGATVDDAELERFWEEYEHYTEKGGNSYIRKKVERLEIAGKL